MLSLLATLPVKKLQFYLWLFIWTMLCSCFLLEGEAFVEAMVRGSNDTFFYTAIIYLNVSLLIPRFYQRQKYSLYIILALLILLTSTVTRVQLQHYFNTQLFADMPSFKPILFRTYSFIFFS